MTDHEDNFDLGKANFNDNNQQTNSLSFLGQNCFGFPIAFLSHFLSLFLKIVCWFWGFYQLNNGNDSTIWVGLFVVQQNTFHLGQDYEHVIF